MCESKNPAVAKGSLVKSSGSQRDSNPICSKELAYSHNSSAESWSVLNSIPIFKFVPFDPLEDKETFSLRPQGAVFHELLQVFPRTVEYGCNQLIRPERSFALCFSDAVNFRRMTQIIVWSRHCRA